MIEKAEGADIGKTNKQTNPKKTNAFISVFIALKCTS